MFRPSPDKRSTRRQKEARNEEALANVQDNMNYQSFPDNAEVSENQQADFRGFSSSITDMFVDPENERVDCCALACCGVFQNDRDRFLISGVKPPSCCKRFWVHIVLPVWLFSMAMFCAVQVKDPYLCQLLSTGFVLALFGYFFFQCIKTMWKRREIRKELLWSKYHMIQTGTLRPRSDEDTMDDSQGEADLSYLMGQTRSDICNAHSLCGCYKADRPRNAAYPDASGMDICSTMFRCFSGMCCGAMCGMYLQLCGICAVAQEARQLEKIMPSKYRRIDYVTMQPHMEYYPAIYAFRHDDEDAQPCGCCTFWSRLSNFSKWVMGILGTVLAVLLAWSVLGLHRSFHFQNYLVFCATLFQAYAVLKIVHWRHTKDISTDALIKFFISGFCLSTTLAVLFELLVGLTLRLIMSLLIHLSGVSEVESSGYTLKSPGFANGFAMDVTADSSSSSSYRDYLTTYGKDHPFVYTLYLLVTAFVLAATTEELCKYFGYRMTEHPDFLSRREIQEAAEVEEEGDDEEGNPSSESEPSLPDFSRQDRSLESRGAAITVAMVATAVGFACCENLVYIFVYGGSTLDVQVVILLARSIFPVHPIAAALQSLRVCQRELEKTEKISLGRVVMPGLIFHGLYDFVLMWIDFLASRKANYFDQDDDSIVDPDGESNWLSFILSIVVMIGAFCYYWRESRMQRHRLRAMDQASSVDQSQLL